MDGRESGVWTLARRRNKTGRGWAWYALSAQGDAAGGGSAPLRLEPGDHTLRISAAEGEVRVDRVLITTDADYRPAGSGSTEVDVEREWRLIEVENTLLGGRVRASDEADVSGGGYLTFRSGRGEEPDGFATLDFEVPRGGRYLVWGRVFAPDDDSNSLYVALDNGDERIWDVPAAARWRGARPWRWDPIGAREDERGGADPLVFELTAGSHELRFRARESGVRLDALIITNDLYHRPSGLSGDGAVDPPVPSGEGVEELEPRVIPITLAPGLEALPG